MNLSLIDHKNRYWCAPSAYIAAICAIMADVRLDSLKIAKSIGWKRVCQVNGCSNRIHGLFWKQGRCYSHGAHRERIVVKWVVQFPKRDQLTKRLTTLVILSPKTAEFDVVKCWCNFYHEKWFKFQTKHWDAIFYSTLNQKGNTRLRADYLTNFWVTKIMSK